jgi:hypothetical protein
MIPIACTPRIDRPHPAMIFCAPRELVLATEVAMAMERWHPKREATRQEEFLLKRLHRTRKLFGFLRRHRHELFDDAFQGELEATYRATGAGKDPVPPALLAMVVLLQSYLGTSDAEAVEFAVVDLRWQMVLGFLGATEPPFSQGALPSLRERLIAHDMDRRLLERTVELARATKEFDWKKLPKTLRVAIDSAPLEGAGRVEDTLNLLAHAARKVVDCAADLLHWTPERVCREARAPLLLAPSIKAALDRDWSDPVQKAAAVRSLVIELENLKDWLAANLAAELKKPPLRRGGDAEAADGAGPRARSTRRRDEDPRGRGGGPARIGRGPRDAPRSEKQDQALRRLQAPHRDRPRLRPHPLRRDHAGEPAGE